MPKRSLFDTLKKLEAINFKASRRLDRRGKYYQRNGKPEEYEKYIDDAVRLEDKTKNVLGICSSLPGGYGSLDWTKCLHSLSGGNNSKWNRDVKSFFDEMQHGIELDPLLYVDDGNPYISGYARKLINGD